jgi:Flp pilus assembly protein TadG
MPPRRPTAATWSRDESGAAAVEFALISTVLITLIFGIFNTGWAIYCGADVRHAIERSARIYIAKPTATETELRTAIESHLMTVPLSDVALTVTKPTVSGAQVAQIAWTYNYTISIPFIPTVVVPLGSQIIAPIRQT